MERGSIRWYKGYRKVKVLRKLENGLVEVLFLEGLGNNRAKVRSEKLAEAESPWARKEREQIELQMKKEQALLERLLNS
jgi:hypothetical protein